MYPILVSARMQYAVYVQIYNRFDTASSIKPRCVVYGGVADLEITVSPFACQRFMISSAGAAEQAPFAPWPLPHANE